MSKLDTIFRCFEELIHRAMEIWRVPGLTVGVVQADKLIYEKGFGVKKLGTKAAVNSQTIFQIGSLSKAFTAALMALLVEEGKLKWTDKVHKHLPEFQLYDSVATKNFTIADLLSQNSGLPPHAGQLLAHLGFSRDSIINRLRCIKPTGTFGKDYSYQNHLNLVAASIIEKYTGDTFESNLNHRLFLPLEMNSTTCTLSEYQRTSNVSCGHYLTNSSPRSNIRRIPVTWPHHQWVYTLAPAAGINSNILDMAKWLKLLLNHGRYKKFQVISRETLKFLLSPQINAQPEPWEESRHYCCGWLQSKYKSHTMIWHNGGTSGMKNILCMMPKLKVGIVILSNLYHTLLPEALARVFIDLYLGHPPQDWVSELYCYELNSVTKLEPPPGPINPHRPLHYYVGTYFNELYGKLSIAKVNGQLILTLGPRKLRLPLKHWGGDTFIIHWPGILTTGAGVQFLSDRWGILNGVTIQGMDDGVKSSFIKLS